MLELPEEAQEIILALPPTANGCPITERALRPIMALDDGEAQQSAIRGLLGDLARLAARIRRQPAASAQQWDCIPQRQLLRAAHDCNPATLLWRPPTRLSRMRTPVAHLVDDDAQFLHPQRQLPWRREFDTMTPDKFESFVRRVARARWPGVVGGNETLAGVRIDGVFRDSDTTHLIEATIERSADKVRADINKLVAARREEEKTAYVVDCWMVVSADPTDNQRQLAKSSRVRLVTIDEFRDPALSQTEYLHLRARYPFGSINDPVGKLPPEKLKRLSTPLVELPSGRPLTLDQITSGLLQGEVIILLGDYGAGKSMATREVYFALEQASVERLGAFPVCINLREQWGQTHASEMFLRHAENLASQHGLRLFHAWREGFVTLLLDGFDEVAPQPWAQDMKGLERIRHLALAAVRDTLEVRPSGAGALIVGRSTYFSSHEEMLQALGLRAADRIVELRELTENEAVDFLRALNVQTDIAHWLPRRPLFLSYLARTGYIDEFSGLSALEDVGKAWNHIIEMVCDREARIAPSMTSDTVAAVLSLLAHQMRSRPSQLGPITDTDLESAFREATAHQPDQDAWAILQRLPGTTYRAKGSKWFVDEEWAAALAGRAFAAVVQGTIDSANRTRFVRSPLSDLGLLVAADQIARQEIEAKDLVGWALAAARAGWDPSLVGDAVFVAEVMAKAEVDFHGLELRNAYCGTLCLQDTLIRGVVFRDCAFSELEVSGRQPRGVQVVDAVVESLIGVRGDAELPSWVTVAEVIRYKFPETNAEILRSRQYPLPVRLGVVVLRKVFVQKGRGRRESALVRGIDPSVLTLARSVIRELETLGYVRSRRTGGGEPIVHPARARVPEMLAKLSRAPDLDETPWFQLQGLG